MSEENLPTQVTTNLEVPNPQKAETSKSPSASPSRSKKELAEGEYDKFLKDDLKGRIKRTGPYNYYKCIPHECQQPECSRKWKPIPRELVETNKNYCPSCVHSWSNKTDRFVGWREWTKDVPNCFYLWSLVDPEKHEKYWKCGRTEEIEEPGKRFPKNEQISYKMKLEDFTVESILHTTSYENNFKYLVTERGLKKTFPVKEFHGKEETFICEDGKKLFREAIDMGLDALQDLKKKKKVAKSKKEK